MKKTLFVGLILLFLTSCSAKTVIDSGVQQDSLNVPKIEELTIVGPMPELPADIAVEKELIPLELPKNIDLPVAFASQAPLSNWDLPYQEACEESALITATKYFYQLPLTNEIMDAEIKAIVEWEKTNFGLYSDTNLAEVQVMADKYFKLQTKIVDNPTIQQIKTEISLGNLVLVPTAGRMLGNKNFKGAGPLYHFVVIRGYDSDQFIVNDVGTRKGNGFKYKYDVLLNAIHDLPLKSDGTILRPFDDSLSDASKEAMMKEGLKKVLVVSGKAN